MSIDMLAGSVLNGASNSKLFDLLIRLEESIDKQARRIPRFTKLLRSSSQLISLNGTAGDIILLGPPVPANHIGIVTDISVNFSTSGGTAKLSVVDPSGKTVLNDVARDLSATASGQATTVLDEGERIALVIQTAGVGALGVLVSGKFQELI